MSHFLPLSKAPLPTLCRTRIFRRKKIMRETSGFSVSIKHLILEADDVAIKRRVNSLSSLGGDDGVVGRKVVH